MPTEILGHMLRTDYARIIGGIMARSARNSKLETRTSRLKIPEGARVYTTIGEGFALGYRRTKKGYGTWEVRHRVSGKYSYQSLGDANDYQESDGERVLTYFEAQDKARLVVEQVKTSGGIIKKPITVEDAIAAYLQWYEANRKAYKETKNTIDTHILPVFGKALVSDITTHQIKHWHQKIATTPPRRRTQASNKQKFGDAPNTDEGKRSRKSTANRILTVLKAVLNKAFNDDFVKDNAAWRRVKPFPNTDEPITRFLTADESIRLINTCPADLRRLVKAALFTGARFGELARLQTKHVNLDTGMIFITPAAKSGKGRHIPLHSDAIDFFKTIIAGNVGSDLVLRKSDDKLWGKNHQVRPLRKACIAAKIEPPISFHELRHTYASMLAQNGVDLLSISKLLGHADIRITSRHYAHLCDQTLRNAAYKLPSFGHIKDEKVIAINLTA